MDVPQSQKAAYISTVGSFTDDVNNSTDGVGEEILEVTASSLLKPTTVIPVTYTPSPYDHFVPAPRNCGGRFNGSGFLVTFGRVNNAFTSSRFPRISKASLGDVTSSTNFFRPQLSTEYASALNSFRRRSFQYYSSVNSTRFLFLIIYQY